MSTRRLVLILSAELIICIIIGLSLFGLRGCSLEPKVNKRTIVNEECSKEYEVKQLECSNGRIFEVCKDGYWFRSFDNCLADDDGGGGGGDVCNDKTIFDPNVANTLTQKCVSCHPGYDQYATAKSKIDDYIARINVGDDNPRRMPKSPAEPLSEDEKNSFQSWKDDGLLEDCADDPIVYPYTDLDYIESNIVEDLQQFSEAQRGTIRYLITSHITNSGQDPDPFKRAIDKAINSLSNRRNITNSQPVDPNGTILRIDLKDYGLERKDWDLVEANDPINFESFTNRGLLIKFLTQTQKPWMHIDSFAFTANQPEVYYTLRDLPATANELFNLIGVDFKDDFADFSALTLGFSDSPISLNKNRLLSRHDSTDGYLWATFDVDGGGAANQNLFEFLLLDAPSGKDFDFQASEMIYSLPNGLQGFILFNADGIRQDAAPLNIVIDNISPFSPEIQSSISCYRCHSIGLIPADDEIAAHVRENAAQFDPQDVDVVRQLYRDPASSFQKDNGRHAEALAKMGISVNDVDPLNFSTDNLRKNHGAASIAALLLLTEEEFILRLSESNQARQEVGQLLVGGSISFSQLVASLPVIIKDLRIGQNPL